MRNSEPTELYLGEVAGHGMAPGDLIGVASREIDLQRRVQPVPELFPGEGGLDPWVLTWGAFACGHGHGGMWVRGTADPDTVAINMHTGASATCCFHEQAPVAPTAAGR